MPNFWRRAACLFVAAGVAAGCTASPPPPPARHAPPPAAATGGPDGDPLAGLIESAAAPARPGAVRIAFAPLTGAPQEIADALALAVARGALERRLALAPFGSAAATYVLKGYVSAVADGDGTLLVYVWDVLAPDLKRLQRITGSIRLPVRAEPAWSVVDPAALQAVAADTLDRLAAWLSAA